MKKVSKKVAVLGLAAVLGLGLLAPMSDMGSVKAAEQKEGDWDVDVMSDKELDGEEVSEELLDVAVVDETVNQDGISEDSMEVAANPGCQTVYGTYCYDYAWQVMNILNQKRIENGAEPLSMDKELLEAAMLRAAELTINWSHTRPSGESCFSVSERAYAENAAYGQTSPEGVMNSWMNSQGHRENMLRNGYNSIGVGCFYKDGVYYWIQLFGYDDAIECSQPANEYVAVEIVTDLASYKAGYTLESRGITVYYSDPAEGFIAYMNTNAPDTEDIEYSWYASQDNGASWSLVSDWVSGKNAIAAVPKQYGDYIIVAKARKNGNDSTIVSASFTYGYHPAIKGICQMPYAGDGGGYLIGIESYENPNNSYSYEMLILDCTLYAQGLPAWTYTTGRCGAPDTCLWTIWQPQYGYYWTLFRVYDGNGTLIDEICYGFENIC